MQYWLTRLVAWMCVSVIWPCLIGQHAFASERAPRPAPVYVPLDSWVYPALRRLANLGYAPDEDRLAAPWTREQCAMLVAEAADISSRHSVKASSGSLNAEAIKLIADLQAEFRETGNVRGQVGVESVYTRLLQITGQPLNDSFHFGQTIVNDYGRPYAEGTNLVQGASAYASWRTLSLYVRGEYQQTSSSLPYGQPLLNLIGALDGVPPQLAKSASPIHRFDALDAYIGIALPAFDLTAGKQTLNWGPGEESAFHFSDNAEPLYALRFAQRTPLLLPGPFRALGRIRTQFLIGRLAEHAYPARPLLNAQKITLQVSPDLEIGFTRSAVFGGVGHPLTIGSAFNSFFSTSSTGGTSFGSANDPGDRRSGFDFIYHVPGLRRRLILYSDSLADDEPSPLSSPRRSAWAPGLYVTQLPGLRGTDLRFETYSTWLYTGDEGGRFFYWNDQYRDGFTNGGNLLGSWIGRDARAYVASVSHWWSATNKISAEYRQIKTGSNFLPGGGTQTDVSLNAQWRIASDLQMTGFLQYERRLIPALGPEKRSFAASIQMTYYPKSWIAKSFYR